MEHAPVRVEMTVAAATDIWLSRYSSVNTRSAYALDLRSFLSWMDDDTAAMAVTPDQIAGYRAERESSGASPATVNRQLAALRSFFDTASALGICDESPFVPRVASPGTTSATTTLTPAEVNLMEEASAIDPRTAVLVHLLLYEGVRLAEVLALDHTDVTGSRTAKQVRINRRGSRSDVRVDTSGSRKLHRLQELGARSGPLLVGPTRQERPPRRLTRFGADHLLKRAAERAGLARQVSANVLRRTYVDAAERRGIPLDDIRQRMGHRDVRTTRRYLTTTTDRPTHL